MKRSAELLGLSVISIEDGKEIGKVCDLVVNPEKGTAEYLIVDIGLRYLGIKVLPFSNVEGIGEDAVTVQSISSVAELGDVPEIPALLEKNVRVKGTRVLTKNGRMIGTVSEYIIDENNGGKISGCEITGPDNSDTGCFVSSDVTITFGRDILVINEGDETGKQTKKPGVQAREEKQEAPKKDTSGDKRSADSKTENNKSEAAKLFEERQREYLLGRKVSKCIETASGEIIAEEGELITEELLDKTRETGKFNELSMNSKA